MSRFHFHRIKEDGMYTGGAPVQLRAYEERDIASIRARFAGGARHVLYQAQTGSGQTVLLSTVAAGAAERGIRAAVFDELGVAHGIIAAAYPETPLLLVQIASVAIPIRGEHFQHHAGLLVEIDKLAAMNYRQALRWARSDKHRCA